MEVKESEPDAPYMDINAFLELVTQSEPGVESLPAPSNGCSDPLLITPPARNVTCRRKPTNQKTAFTFVDVGRILRPPSLPVFQPRLPACITLTRSKAPVVATARPQNIRPQATNNSLRFRFNPCATIRPALNVQCVNNSKRLLSNLRQSPPGQFNTRQLNPRLLNPCQLNPRLLSPRQLNPHLLNPSQLNPHQFNPRQFNPRQCGPRLKNAQFTNNANSLRLSIRQVGPRQFNAGQCNPRQFNPLQLNPRQVSPALARQLNQNQLNAKFANTIRLQRIPGQVAANSVRTQLKPRFVNSNTNSRLNQNPMNIARRVGLSSNAQLQAQEHKLYQETMNAIRAKTGVTLVPLGTRGPLGNVASPSKTSDKPLTISIQPAARSVSKVEPRVKRERVEDVDNACNICLKTFNHPKSLRRHMLRSHKNVMNELPARKSSRISTQDPKSMMVSTSDSEVEEEVEVLPPPVKKAKELVNLSDGDDDDSGMLDITRFLEVNLTDGTPSTITDQPALCRDVTVAVQRLADWVSKDVTYSVHKQGGTYTIQCPVSTQPSSQHSVETQDAVAIRTHETALVQDPKSMMVSTSDSEVEEEVEVLPPPVKKAKELVNLSDGDDDDSELAPYDPVLPLAHLDVAPSLELEPLIELEPSLELEPALLAFEPAPLPLSPTPLQVSTTPLQSSIMEMEPAYFCQVCRESFPNNEQLVGHICSQFVCECCHQCFTDCTLMIEHLKAHIETSSFVV